MRAALYARVSTSSQSTAAQLDELRAVARQRRWRVVDVGKDVGSGARSDLPERARLLELARRGGIDVLAVWRLDRLGRSVRDLLDAAETLRRERVELVSLRDAVDTTTPAGRLVFTVLAGVAELEREVIRERVLAGLERAKREGKKLGRPRVAIDVARARELLAHHSPRGYYWQPYRGKSIRDVARELGYAESTLRRALAAAAASETPAERPPKSGRKPTARARSSRLAKR